MRIAIIGSGNVGKALGGSAIRAGHDVTLTASSPDNAAEAAQKTGAKAAASNAEAVAGADIVIKNGWPWQSSWTLVGPTGDV
jgi:8-hydroxy-5-deazaflavin:NADPH oxidoreductase